MPAPSAADPLFFVLLGPDYAGKSTTMSMLAGGPSPCRFVSVDDCFLGPGHGLISRLRRQLVAETLPALGTGYSADFAATLLQTAVVHLRDQVLAGDCRRPALVDSYYYKILAKCRLAGSTDHPMFGWWRSFPQPRRVLYLDVAPRTAWQRSRAGAAANRLEHYGDRPDRAGFEAFQRDLGGLLREEVRHLPVTVIGERAGAAGAAAAVREVLADECG